MLTYEYLLSMPTAYFIHREAQSADKPATRKSRGLYGSFYGLLAPIVHIVGNSYEGKRWPTSEHSIGYEKDSDMELKSLEVDFSRIKYWASRLNPQVVIEEPEARGQYIREVL